MTSEHRGAPHRDGARQAAVVAGALLQIAGNPLSLLLGGADVAQLSDQNHTLVTPAGYAFAIWGPIFALSLGYAVYQALPAQRENPLLRRIGWWTAGTFLFSTAWELAFPFQRYLVAEGLIVGALGCAAVAFVRFARAGEPALEGRAARWLTAPMLGLYLGWITAANVVSFLVTLVATDRLADGTPQAVLGGALLLGCGVAAAAFVRVAKSAPPAAALGVGGAALWALAAVVVNQRDDSTLTTAAAVAAAVPVVAALVGRLPLPGFRRRATAAAPTLPAA